MELAEMSCTRCGAPIAHEDIDLDLAMARCAHCGTVFKIKEPALPPDVPPMRERPAVPLPKNVEVKQEGDGLVISYRWFTPAFIFMIFFAVFWNGFMVVWHGISLASGAWFMSLFGLLHTAVGIGVGYYTLAGLVNRTVVHVELGTLSITHTPLPWFGSKRVAVDDIRQVYCKEKISRSKNGTSVTYEVHAVLENAAKEALMKRLQEPEQALYVEQQIEKYLGIEDRPVAGELPR
jgi:DNA-directed RNA polymerase subunit RPC12/RpoP